MICISISILITDKHVMRYVGNNYIYIYIYIERESERGERGWSCET